MESPTDRKKFEDRILREIRHRSMLRRGDKVLAALSGGPDSVCLTSVLTSLHRQLGVTISAGHVNYHLRGPESDEEELFVRRFCAEKGIPLHCRSVDPEELEAGNMEENARRIRYEFLSEIACRDKMIIATGHNADDQAETFIFNLLRGSGYKGLSGMAPARLHMDSGNCSCLVIRPLLFVSRRMILEYLEAGKQAFREDSSNLDISLDRNWIRHELLPLLESRFSTRPGERIASASVLIGEAARFLEEEAKRKLIEIADVEKESRLRIPIREMLAMPEALAKELIRQAISRIRGDLADVSGSHIHAVLSLLQGQSGKQISLPGEVEARREFGFLLVYRPQGSTREFEYTPDLPCRMQIPEAGKILAVQPAGSSADAGGRGDANFRITVRNRRAGDKLKLSAGRPRQSFSNICNRHRIPESERDRILIIELPDKTHWIEGTGMGDTLKFDEKHEFKIDISETGGR